MAATVLVTAAKTWAETEDPIDASKLNLTATPTVVVTVNMSQIDDTNITAPDDKAPFVYDSASGKWIDGIVGQEFIEAFTGAGAAAGTTGGVPAPGAGETGFLDATGNWSQPTGAQTSSNLYNNRNFF